MKSPGSAFYVQRPPKMTSAIIIAVFLGFVVQSLVVGVFNVDPFDWLAMFSRDVATAAGGEGFRGKPFWQVFTYPLVYYPGPQQVQEWLFDLLFLYFLLPQFEERFGATRTLQLAAVGALAAALSWPLFLLFPGWLAGAGPICAAAIAAMPVYSKNREIRFLFLPPMSAWFAVGFYVLVRLLSALRARNPTLLMAELFAVIAAVLFTRYLMRTKKKSAKPNPFRVVQGGKDTWLN